MSQPLSRSIMPSYYLIILLLLLTPALLIWQHFGMTRIVELSPRNPHGVRVTDDRYEKGNSTSYLEHTKEALIMRCTLGEVYAWPFCKMQFLLGSPANGVDLSQFDTIEFDIHYSGPSPNAFRLHIINFEPGISVLENWNSQRYNEVEIELPAEPTFTIPMNVLHTADWWRKLRKVPLSKTYTRYDNVTAVELATASPPPGQALALEVRSIRFRGKWISRATLLMYLVYAWIASGILGLSLGLLHLRSSLLASNSRSELLATVNKALQLEARELADQAHTDPLTGALNRQGLREALMRPSAHPGHEGDNMAVIFLDLDHFKQINDRHGHHAGDEVLRRFAAMVRHEVRANDKLVRWGGEEFLLVCPNTTRDHAAKLAEKLRSAMSAQVWPNGIGVTASFGAAALAPEEDLGAAIARADSALYAAKSNGRNRVEVA